MNNVNDSISRDSIPRESLAPVNISAPAASQEEATGEEQPLLAQQARERRPLWIAQLPERIRSFTSTHPTALPLAAVISSAAGVVSMGAGLAARVDASSDNNVDHAFISLAGILEISAATLSMVHETIKTTSWTNNTKNALTTFTLLTALGATATAIAAALQPTADERRPLWYTSAGLALPQVAWMLKEIPTHPKISQQIDPVRNRSKDRAWMSYGLSEGLLGSAVFMLLLSNKDELSHFAGKTTLAGAFTLSLALAATFAKRYSTAQAEAFSNVGAIVPA